MDNVMISEGERPPTEVTSKAARRKFSADYKRRILREAEQAKKTGELGALLRREGLYSSHIAKWRELAEKGQSAGLAPKKRGPVAKVVDPRDKRIAQLERENRKMAARVERAEALVELQKKVAILMGTALPSEDEM